MPRLSRARQRRSIQSCFRALTCSISLLGAATTGSAEKLGNLITWSELTGAHNPIVVTLSDSYGLFSDSIFASAKEELETIFSPAGGSVTLKLVRRGPIPTTPFYSVAVNAVAMPIEPARWGLPRNAMAAVIREPNKRGAIYVFAPRFKMALGHDLFRTNPDKDPTESFLAGRALGRVIAHELVHLLVPNSSHTDSGLMAAQLNRNILTRRDLPLDTESMLRLNLVVWEQGRDQARAHLAHLRRTPASPIDPRLSTGPVTK